jgi:hypothetical protein
MTKDKRNLSDIKYQKNVQFFFCLENAQSFLKRRNLLHKLDDTKKIYDKKGKFAFNLRIQKKAQDANEKRK